MRIASSVKGRLRKSFVWMLFFGRLILDSVFFWKAPLGVCASFHVLSGNGGFYHDSGTSQGGSNAEFTAASKTQPACKRAEHAK